MKKCYTCKETKPIADFYKKGNSGRINSLCKICFNKYCMNRWIERKQEMIELLGGKCCRCGYLKFYGALEFHHRDPSKKEFDWKKTRQMSHDKMVSEIKKCDLVCANCHRELHSELHSTRPVGIAPTQLNLED